MVISILSFVMFASESTFYFLGKSEGPRPVMVSRSRAGFTLNIIDTPGLIEGGYINDMALDIIKRYAYVSHVIFQL